MRQEVLGVERRRRWTDDEKLAVVSEVGVNGATVADVARGHDITRQHIYQWRRELRAKGMWNDREDMRFLRLPEAEAPRRSAAAAVEIVLCNGRALRGVEGLGADDLAWLIRVVESA
jgi:transposase